MIFSRLSALSLPSLVLLAVLSSPSCGSADAGALNKATCSGDCSCTGDSCTCKAGGTCTFGPTTSPSSSDAGTSADGAALPSGTSPTALPNDVTYHCDAQGTCAIKVPAERSCTAGQSASAARFPLRVSRTALALCPPGAHHPSRFNHRSSSGDSSRSSAGRLGRVSLS